MGEIERKSAKAARRKNIQDAVLAVVVGSLLLGTAILAPNTLQMFSKLGITGKRRKESINRARNNLLEKGLLMKDDGGYLQITNKGRLKLGDFDDLIDKPRHWDKKWRVLVFDIPEKRRKARDQIRNVLVEAGFTRLQNSVWVYPYNCEDFVALLKAQQHIGKALLYMVVDSIENDKYLKEVFALKD
jgi:DNA-binding transcriptional regulator PaaX